MRILIVGAGLFGSVCARELADAGHDCHVVEKRSHIGGNCYTRYCAEADCHEHVYGAHIFHTNSKRIWEYLNQFADFNHYVNRVKIRWRDQFYSFPINLFTLHQMFGVTSPEEARCVLAGKIVPCTKPRNMEEYCLSIVGREIYERFIEGYTCKQWQRHPRDLPAEIAKRLPVRLNFDDNYFNDRYQGIPIGGYTAVFDNMLRNVRVDLGVDFLADRDLLLGLYDHVIYTGPIDAFFDYQLGPLEYRSLRFETELVDCPDYQGNAVINYPEVDVPWTRILEHKHFDLSQGAAKSLITREYPADWRRGLTEYYPVADEHNTTRLKEYQTLAEEMNGKVHFGGRLGEYRYYDMHQVVGAALHFVAQFTERY